MHLEFYSTTRYGDSRDMWSAEHKYCLGQVLPRARRYLWLYCFGWIRISSRLLAHTIYRSAASAAAQHTQHIYTQWPRRFPVGRVERTDTGVLEPGLEVLPVVSVSTATARLPYISFSANAYHCVQKYTQPKARSYT